MNDSSITVGFQTKATLKGLLDAAGLAPNKRYGQCFLIDRNLMHKLLEAAQLTPDDCVLEVGCGTGSLTGELAQRAGRVITVEVDEGLAAIAAERFDPIANVTLVKTDALAGKSQVAPAVLEALQDAQTAVNGRRLLVANLPYDIATPLILNLMLADLGFERLCFTVQAEVADRLLATPGGRHYGPASVIVQSLATLRRICQVPPQAFWPAPKVSSSMVCIDADADKRAALSDPSGLAAVVRRFFQNRRKTMSHIARTLGQGEPFFAAMEANGVKESVRPETVTVSQWIALHDAGDWKGLVGAI